MLWRLMPVLAAALIIGGAAYIVVRTHRFGFMRALAQRHKLLSWLLALIPIGLVGLFGLVFNITAMAVVFLHLLLAWEPCQNDWYRIKHMATPKVLLDSLVDTYANYLEDQITENRRELTAEETKEIQAKCRLLYERCQA